MAIRVIVIYFVLKDSFTFVIRGIFSKIKSNGMVQLIWLGAFDISKIIFGISKLFILPKIGKYSYFVYVFYLCCYGVQGILLSLFMFIKMKKIKEQ